jgi:hypothetical protein
MSVEKSFPFFPFPFRDKMFSSPHYVPDGTLVSGGIFLSTDMLGGEGMVFFYRYNVPGGTENNIFRTGFFKNNEYYIFIPHLRDR